MIIFYDYLYYSSWLNYINFFHISRRAVESIMRFYYYFYYSIIIISSIISSISLLFLLLYYYLFSIINSIIIFSGYNQLQIRLQRFSIFWLCLHSAFFFIYSIYFFLQSKADYLKKRTCSNLESSNVLLNKINYLESYNISTLL